VPETLTLNPIETAYPGTRRGFAQGIDRPPKWAAATFASSLAEFAWISCGFLFFNREGGHPLPYTMTPLSHNITGVNYR
jgi:hypothetical protein